MKPSSSRRNGMLALPVPKDLRPEQTCPCCFVSCRLLTQQDPPSPPAGQNSWMCNPICVLPAVFYIQSHLAVKLAGWLRISLAISCLGCMSRCRKCAGGCVSSFSREGKSPPGAQCCLLGRGAVRRFEILRVSGGEEDVCCFAPRLSSES